MRFTSFWTTAATLPTTSDAIASAPTAGRQSFRNSGNDTWNTRTRAANPATLVADDMNAVTGVGAPWYTSGVHMWNGTAATLNPRPTRSSPRPMSSTPSSSSVLAARKREMPVSEVVPVAPYTSATPYRNTADEKAPSTKYLIPASWDARRRRSNAASTYSGIERISSARNTTTRSLAVVIASIPAADRSMSARYSGPS